MHEFLEAHAAVDEEEDRQEKQEGVKLPKEMRVKSYQFLRGLDHALLCSCGVAGSAKLICAVFLCSSSWQLRVVRAAAGRALMSGAGHGGRIRSR
jgi:hypothetical protein